MDGTEGEDMSSIVGSSSSTTTTSSSSPGRAGIKCCAGCQTTKTPLWRGGPDGPKSLCNACGIRYRKRRREVLGIDDQQHPPAASAAGDDTATATTTTATSKKRKRTPNKAVAASAKLNALGFSPKLQGDRDRQLNQNLLVWLKTRQPRSRLREEEQAAVLLMALSCGLLYA